LRGPRIEALAGAVDRRRRARVPGVLTGPGSERPGSSSARMRQRGMRHARDRPVAGGPAGRCLAAAALPSRPAAGRSRHAFARANGGIMLPAMKTSGRPVVLQAPAGRKGRNTSMNGRLSRRLTPLLLGGALALAGLSAAPAQENELRIGFLAPRTGIFTAIGTDMVNGFQLYLDEHNGMLGGVKVKLIVEDDQGKPDVDVAKAKKLILQDKVHMLVGALLASSAYALGPVSTSEKTLYLASSATADDIAQRQASKFPYVAFSTWVPSLPNHPLGQWACDQGYKRMVAIAADYAFGYEQLGGFQKAFEDCGGKIIQKIWAPLGTKDFGPYIPTMKQDADAIFSLMVGPMALQFPKQLRASGNKKPIVAGGTSYDEFVLPFMGDEVVGDVSALMYSAAITTKKTEDFVKRYRAKYNKVPSYYSEGNYTTAHWIDEVMKKHGGKFPGPEQFIKTMATIKLDAPRGPVELDLETKSPVMNVYIKKVEKKKMFGYPKDELWNTVIKSYEKVGTFYTYDKAKFRAQPVYSRDFPPCKFCE
jgi:branched-chain amino acid transport system substrate-binding protein